MVDWRFVRTLSKRARPSQYLLYDPLMRKPIRKPRICTSESWLLLKSRTSSLSHTSTCAARITTPMPRRICGQRSQQNHPTAFTCFHTHKGRERGLEALARALRRLSLGTEKSVKSRGDGRNLSLLYSPVEHGLADAGLHLLSGDFKH